MSVPVRPTHVLQNLRADMSGVTDRSSLAAAKAVPYSTAVDKTAVAASAVESLCRVDYAVHYAARSPRIIAGRPLRILLLGYIRPASVFLRLPSVLGDSIDYLAHVLLIHLPSLSVPLSIVEHHPLCHSFCHATAAAQPTPPTATLPSERHPTSSAVFSTRRNKGLCLQWRQRRPATKK